MKLVHVKKAALTTASLLAVAGIGLAGAAPASATSSHSIDGTVYKGGAYYLSSTVPTDNGNNIQIQLDQRPSRGIDWRLYSTNKGTYFAGPVSINNNSTYPLSTNVINGTKFQNSYREGGGSCPFSCNYNFSGSLFY